MALRSLRAGGSLWGVVVGRGGKLTANFRSASMRVYCSRTEWAVGSDFLAPMRRDVRISVLAMVRARRSFGSVRADFDVDRVRKSTIFTSLIKEAYVSHVRRPSRSALVN